MKRVFSLVATILLSIGVFAQMPQNLPLDPKVKSGRLENGLTYFIMQNNEPVGQAEFFIVQKVGSILEEENQRGLAHFLEHMAFNGTKNFPGNGVISYLETIGVKFGANLNAYTSIEETVYNISSVPVKREGIIDSCLLILHDWANEILLEEEDIDDERGVIREELRTRTNANMRMLESILLQVMPDNKYAHRLPIGLLEVINNFSYQELRDYYEKWYRPDLQGIIVVGDIDPNSIEEKIKTIFADIPTPVNAAERVEIEVADNKEPLIGIASDPEATFTSIMLMYKKEPMPKELRPTATSLVFNFMNKMVVDMLNSRLADITQQANPPFIGARSYYGKFLVADTKYSFDINAGAKDGELENAIRAIVAEAEKVKRYGFTESELERAKANYSSNMEQTYNEREKLRSSYFTGALQNHFLTDEAYPGIEAEYMLMQQIMPMITLEQINAYAQTLPTEENVVLAVMMPQKEALAIPTKEALLEIFNSARMAEVEPYQETLSNEPLISHEIKAGKVVSETAEPMSNGKVWSLSNGATVVFKKTDFKEDQILFRASSRGGHSLFDTEDIISTKVVTDLVSLGGLGNFSTSDLRKVLAGKNVSITPSISTTSESLSGNTTPKDLETLMQLIYLSFTSLRQDNDAFQSWMIRMESQLKNTEASPMTAYSDTLSKTLYNNSPYSKRLDSEMLKEVDYERALTLGRERFSNAADFVFTFVGNIDETALKGLVETYIASLPASISGKENWSIIDNAFAQGKITKQFNKEMQTPKSTVYSIFNGEIDYNLENIIMGSMVKQVFDIVFTRTVREEEQGTYGVGVNFSLQYYPKEQYMFLLGFDTDVELRERLLNRAYTEIDNVVEKGVEQEDFNKIVEYMNKNYEENLRENSYWLSVINSRFLLGRDIHTTYKTALDSITTEKLDNFIKEVFSTENRIEVIMDGVEPSSN